MTSERDVRLPEIEVIVRATAFDVAMVCFFMGKTPHDDIEVVATVYDTSDIANICEALQECIKALRAGGWESLDELHSGTVSNENGPPF